MSGSPTRPSGDPVRALFVAANTTPRYRTDDPGGGGIGVVVIIISAGRRRAKAI